MSILSSTWPGNEFDNHMNEQHPQASSLSLVSEASSPVIDFDDVEEDDGDDPPLEASARI